MQKTAWICSVAVLTFLAAGCGNSATTPPANIANQTASANVAGKAPSVSPNGHGGLIVGGEAYQGQANLAKYEKDADTHPSDAHAQIQAGISAYVNGDMQKAISYYKKAISDDPKNALPYNNLGNVYFRGLKQPKEALPYYQKATQVDPSYAYGWLNLGLCELELGDKSAAKTAFQQGLSKTSKSDPLYKAFQDNLKKLG
ncbi:MAG: tetratricopeptide repeat protein [Alicyclobacillus macrosporangiidus]|uniref:tetratricopeptide repeat protein n=1 Tax=Alicyclobacillus macrosporangiidus TaxID=392015 RepID=UPI0026F2A9E4|nr:tetratricopeptide repeat protein [Alicyclobacillus macrosporangiidus]MCL6599138.1 tetratricopeptide repeat protein [Alicyclobacillus macrosporangiidus]